jgi:putative acetyltransferase
VTTVRPARPSDGAVIRAVTTRAFDDAQVADLVDELARGPARVSLVAETDGAVVGHTMLSRGWIDAERELVDVLVLSPLSVDPPVQRRGIGTALVRAALTAAADLSAPAVFLEGSPTYYARFGFEAAQPLGFDRPSVRIPSRAFQVALLADRAPELRGALVYPDAFWRLDFVGLRGEALRRALSASGDAAEPPGSSQPPSSNMIT